MPDGCCEDAQEARRKVPKRSGTMRWDFIKEKEEEGELMVFYGRISLHRYIHIAAHFLGAFPREHHESAHERTEKKRQEWQKYCGVHLSCCHEESPDTGDGEEDSQCFR
jgi:hypothetical protein